MTRRSPSDGPRATYSRLLAVIEASIRLAASKVKVRYGGLLTILVAGILLIAGAISVGAGLSNQRRHSIRATGPHGLTNSEVSAASAAERKRSSFVSSRACAEQRLRT